MSKKELSAGIKACRKSKKMTVAQVAKRAGCGESTVYAVENGTHDPTISTLCKISHGLGIKPWTLLKRCASLTPGVVGNPSP